MPTQTIGLFLLLAGFILGLGAVTVIDLHGFLGRKSSYWTEATIRTHKITKPLIWLGLSLALLGGTLYYSTQGFPPIAQTHLLIAILLILNGFFLSFKVSPYLLAQEKQGNASRLLPATLQFQITISFLISFFGWWTSLLLLTQHLVAQ